MVISFGGESLHLTVEYDSGDYKVEDGRTAALHWAGDGGLRQTG
jgi:hypothetical protein